MVAKFDYFHIGYATAAAVIKFSFFVEVISSRYFLTVFNFPDFPHQRVSSPGSPFRSLAAERSDDETFRPHMIIPPKVTYVPGIAGLYSVEKGRVCRSRIEYLPMDIEFREETRGNTSSRPPSTYLYLF